MFAFAIYDKNKSRLCLFRDHMGIKPLYYAYKNGFLSFSSELKGLTSLFSVQGVGLEPDPGALEFYAVFGYIPSPYTLYHDIAKLPKSSWLFFDLATKAPPKIFSYSLRDVAVTTRNEFMQLIEERTLEHLASDVPVGVFFSGGTDSSLIASILHKYGINLKAFSIQMRGKEEDAYYFTEISKRLGLHTEMHSFGVKEFDEIYPTVMKNIDEPISDNSIFPTYYLSKKAAEEVKVVLSGEGGDELFLGYPRNLALERIRGKAEGYTLLDALYTHLPFFRGKNFLFERLFMWTRQPVSYYLVHMSPSRGFASSAAWHHAKELIVESGVEPLALDREFYLENNLLKKIDMATSYASIEGRVPLLDRGIVANASRFNQFHLEGGVLKAMLKKILTQYLPPELVYRGKSGFGMDLHQYFKESRYLKQDLERAIAFFTKKGMLLPKHLLQRQDVFIQRSPNYCFSLISLYYAFQNTQKR